MTIVVKDRVKVTTATTGTGTLTLGSAETDFQSFSVIGNGNQTYYAIKSDAGWEVGIGTYTHSGTTLSRDTILESSNSGSAVSLTGTSTVFTTYPAERASFSDQGLSKTFTADGAITAGKPTILTSAGKAQQVAETGNSVTEGFGATTNFIGNNGNYSPKNLAVIGTDKVATVYTDDSNSDYPTVQVGEVNGSTNAITWGTKTVIDSNPTNGTGIVWKSSDSTLGVLYRTSSWAEVRGCTVSGTSVTVGGSNLSLSVVNTNLYGAMLDPDTDEMICWIMDYVSSQRVLKSFAVNLDGTNTPTLSHSDTTSALNNVWWGTGSALSYTYDTNINAFIITGEKDEPDTAVRFLVQTNTGSAFTTTERTKSITGFQGYGVFCFDSTNNKVVYAFKDSSSKVGIVNLTMSANDFTVGSITTTTLVNGGGIIWLAYDPSSQRVVTFSSKATTAGANYGVYSNDGTTLTEISTADFGSTTQDYWAQRGAISQTAMTGLASNPIVLAMRTNVSATSWAGAFSVGQTPVSNLDNNYLGVASTTASDTEEVKINLPEGSINNSQSGLEIGEDYFCNTSGEIKKFRSSSTSGVVTEAYSAETALNDPSEKVTVVSDGNNTFLQVYQGSSMYSTIQAGTMSGTTMTWGTAQVIESTDGSGHAIWWDSYRSCFVVVVRSTTGNSYIEASTITVTGQAITVNNSATTQVFSGTDQSSMTGGYDSTAQVGFVHNSTGSGGEKSSVIVVSVDSSKNVSFGTEVTNTTKVTYPSQFVHDSNGNANIAVIGATYDGSTEVTSTQAYIITISGTTPTIQTPVVLNTTAYAHGYPIYDASAQKTVCVYEDGSNIAYNVCSVSSGTLTAGTHTTITAGEIDSDLQEWAICGCYDPFTEQIGIVYSDSSNYMYLRSGKVSGTSITWSDAQAVDPSTVNKHVNLANANSTDSNVLVLYWVNYDSAFNTWTMGSAGTTTYTQTDAQYIGEALSTTALKLKETPTDIIFGKASNTIAKGNPVLVEADGDFAKVEGDSTAVSYSAGTETEIKAGWTDVYSVSYNTEQSRFLAVYRDQDYYLYGMARCVSVSNKTLTMGTESGYFNMGSTQIIDSVYIGDSKHVIVYKNNSSYATAIVATVSGDSITYGTPVSFYSSSNGNRGSIYYDSSKSAVVWVSSTHNSLLYLSMCAMTISGTTITAGSVVQEAGYSNTDYYSSAYDENSSIGLIAFRNTSDDGYLATVSVSGTTPSLNTPVNYNGTTNVTQRADSLTYDPVSKKCFLVFGNVSDSKPYGIVATVSGTSVTVGSPIEISTTTSSGNNAAQATDQGGILVTFRDGSSPYYLKSAIATISGTSFTVTNSATLNSAGTGGEPQSVAYQPSDYTVLAIYEDNSSHDLQGVCVIPEGAVTTYPLTTENFIGLADNASSANSTSKVRINGVDANNSGLTAGQLYYVKNDGTLSETAESGKVVEAGKAISATKLLVKG